MEGATASRTAMVTAMMRSCHTRSDPKPLFDDPWGDRLVPEAAHAAVRQRALDGKETVDRYLRRQPVYGNVVLRSRYAEDALERAVREGTRQYVVVGAGFDSFFLRRPAFARDLEVFEIDHPATQSLKLRQLKECSIAAPAATHFIAADLGAEGIGAALARSSFRSDAPAFFAWLGVTMYLPMDANLATLRGIARSAAPGSGLVFTYLDKRALVPGAQGAAMQQVARTVTSLSEPFLSGFDPAGLPGLLRGLGLDLVEDLAGPQLVQRYDASGANGLRSTSNSRIALAQVLRTA